MITKATLSILGLYRYDPTIFSEMWLPAVITDKGDEHLVYEQILLEYAELEVLYPDPAVMKQAIAVWSQSRIQAWTRMARVLYENYDPFINIKRDETRTITETRDLADQNTGKVSAWNESDFTDRTQTDASQKGTVTTEEHFHVEGDSAITDAQDVLKKEMDVRIRYDLYRLILAEFKERFLIGVY